MPNVRGRIGMRRAQPSGDRETREGGAGDMLESEGEAERGSPSDECDVERKNFWLLWKIVYG